MNVMVQLSTPLQTTHSHNLPIYTFGIAVVSMLAVAIPDNIRSAILATAGFFIVVVHYFTCWSLFICAVFLKFSFYKEAA